ncbi:putative methyltransferase [Aspergillus ambiguus]|uniref:putative methyltransferase n=1 Tax=Aspergillus ambiguus TaxID=176160 RepID=UPI003CCCB0DF
MSTTTTTTTTTTSIPSGPVEASLTFYSPPADNAPPYNYVESPPPGLPQRNYGEHTTSVPLQDIRADPTAYTLDKDAFAVLSHIPTATTPATFSDDAAVRTTYYPEVEALLLDTLHARRVVIFDHTIRRQNPSADRQPVHRAHVDQTARAAADRVRLHAGSPAEAQRVFDSGERYRIVNVWRPLVPVVESSPLAFASARSVDPAADLVPVQHRYPHRTGETMAVRYNPAQRWMYLSAMRDHERLLLKCSDTADGVGKSVPHTAFWHPRTPEGAAPRESIEVRALVFG